MVWTNGSKQVRLGPEPCFSGRKTEVWPREEMGPECLVGGELGPRLGDLTEIVREGLEGSDPRAWTLV